MTPDPYNLARPRRLWRSAAGASIAANTARLGLAGPFPGAAAGDLYSFGLLRAHLNEAPTASIQTWLLEVRQSDHSFLTMEGYAGRTVVQITAGEGDLPRLVRWAFPLPLEDWRVGLENSNLAALVFSASIDLYAFPVGSANWLNS